MRSHRRSTVIPTVTLAVVVILAAALAVVAVRASANQSNSTAHVPFTGSLDPLTRVGLANAHPHVAIHSNGGPSGVPVPVGNIPGWTQVYRDNFRTSVPVGGFSGCSPGSTLMTSNCTGLPKSVESKLFAYPNGWSDNHHGAYEPSQVLSIHNGVLDYDLQSSSSGTHMVAAVEPKIPGGVDGNGHMYGAYVVRFRADLVPGYKTAFLLWPDSEKWPADGEIDFPEGNLNGKIQAAMHYMGGTSLLSQDVYSSRTGYAKWHTAVIEWTPQLCRFILDGHVVGTSVSLIPSTPMHWVLQAETEGGNVIPTNSAAGHVYIAWIAAYKPTGKPA